MNSESLIIKTAIRTLEIEAETLQQLKATIGSTFEAAVRAIFGCKGRVVVTGIGKSAIVAQKIVATFNSTGTPALFMHAADAVHGDLGMIQPEDVILCLSKSGETQEIKLLLPMLRQRGTCIIGMAANAQSYLATCADYCLLTPTPQEADPNNLAPTASTTAQMALGDAMATALLALRGFSPEDFARIHPGGSLGKQLYLRVSDLFPNNEKPTVHPQDSLRRTILEMTSKRLGATAVVDEQGALCGIITDGDLRRMLESERDWTGLRAEDIMTRQPKCIAPQALAVKALEMMRHYSITSLVVAEGSRYYGFVHLHDLLREGII